MATAVRASAATPRIVVVGADVQADAVVVGPAEIAAACRACDSAAIDAAQRRVAALRVAATEAALARATA